MGCASSMSVTHSKKHPNTIIIKGTKHNVSLKGYYDKDRNDRQQFGKSIVMGLIRDRRDRLNSDANLIHVGYIKSNSMYGRPKPTEDDFKFIEQRLTPHEIESQHTETTILTDTDSSEHGSTLPRRGRTILIPPATQSRSQSRATPFWGAVDYQKRFNEIKDLKAPKSRASSEIESAKPRTRKKKVAEPSRMEIVNHVSREEFRNEPSTSKDLEVSQPPPISIVHVQLKNKRHTEVQQQNHNQDDVSESSCVVAHHTLNVAWEQDYQHRGPNRLGPKWHKHGSDSETEETDPQKRRTQSVAESDEIRVLDD